MTPRGSELRLLTVDGEERGKKGEDDTVKRDGKRMKRISNAGTSTKS